MTKVVTQVVTHRNLCDIEYTMQRAVNAAYVFASAGEREEMREGMRIIAEVRHAGVFLLDDSTEDDMKKEVVSDLIYRLFRVEI